MLFDKVVVGLTDCDSCDEVVIAVGGIGGIDCFHKVEKVTLMECLIIPSFGHMLAPPESMRDFPCRPTTFSALGGFFLSSVMT